MSDIQENENNPESRCDPAGDTTLLATDKDQPSPLAVRFLRRMRGKAKQNARTREEKVKMGWVGKLDADDSGRGHIRAGHYAAAILLARAIEAEKGLETKLTTGGPVVTVTLAQEHFQLVEDVLSICLARPEPNKTSGSVARREKNVLVITASEKETQFGASASRSRLETALAEGKTIFGLSPKPKSYLPDLLVRAADYRLSLPALDMTSIKMILTAIIGAPFRSVLPPALASRVGLLDIDDIVIACRTDSGAEEIIGKLMQLAGAKNKGSAPAQSPGPTLQELHGFGEAKVWGLQLAADLADYKAGRLAWEQVDGHSVLLYGPPGTGKTSFAAALARTAGVPLVATSVADWNSVRYLSGTLQAINTAFDEASRRSPSILFIDEFEGISDRSSLDGEHQAYWSQIVNLLLQKLSDPVVRRGVVVVTATNHRHRIDPALLRSGRVDRHIQLAPPTTEELVQIFRFYLKDDLADAELMPLAIAADGKTGADVEMTVRRARARARAGNRPLVLEDVSAELAGGLQPPNDGERKIIAVHEAGHAVVAHLLGATVHSLAVTVHGGLTKTKPPSGQMETIEMVDNAIAEIMAGRAAEKIAFGQTTLGSGGALVSDICLATKLAMEMELKHGVGTFGPVFFGDVDQRLLWTNPRLTAALRDRIEAAETRAFDILQSNRPFLDEVAEALAKTDYLDAEQFRTVAARHAPATGSSLDCTV